MRLALLTLCAVACFGQGQVDSIWISAHPYPAWAASVAFLAVAETADIASSRGSYELNPVLGRGPFGARQASIKAGIVGGVILAEWLILRRHPDSSRAFKWANYIAGGVTVGVAIRNWRH